MVDILIAAIFSSFGLGYIACYHVEQYFRKRRERIVDAEVIEEQLTLPLK